MDMGHFKIYPNLYVVLVGSPGARKTTAMACAKALLRQLKTIPISADSTTAESIKEVMSATTAIRTFAYGEKKLNYTPLACFVTELSEFLGVASTNMVSFLTTIYDEPVHEYRTKKGGQQLIVGPYLTLLGCTTPAWIIARLHDDVISGGFSRRAVFVNPPEYDYKNPIPSESKEEVDAWFRLVAHGEQMGDIGGEFVWSKAGKQAYIDWYMAQKMPSDPNLIGWARGRHAQLIKIAMLVALSEGRDLILTEGHVHATQEILIDVEERLSFVFAGFGRNELKGVAMKFYQLLEASGGAMVKQEARARMWDNCNDNEFFQIIEHLKECKLVVELQPKAPNPSNKPTLLLTFAKAAELP